MEKELRDLIRMRFYFERHASGNRLFVPEYKAALAIAELLEKGDAFTMEDAAKVRTIIKEVESGEHYDGSGWLDFKIHLNGWLASRGL
jgi:uncharacterized protein (DUF58 family)